MMKNNIEKILDELIPNPVCELNYTKDYELLLAIMLSAQSTDKKVNEVTKNLFKYDIYELANMDIKRIESIIREVGTYHRKALYIKDICSKLINDYNGFVPHDRDYIESLKGCGHKTCNVLFSELFNENCIAVDTHVSRVSKRLGLALECDSVLDIEKKLEKTFKKESWSKIHKQLVLFGRYYCKSIKPSCTDCPFRNIGSTRLSGEHFFDNPL